MTMKPLVAAGILLGTALSTASGAYAADLARRPLYTKAPVMAAIYDWTGFYIGVNAGGGVGRSRTEHAISGNSNDTLYQQPSGALGGAQIGYNWQTNAGFLGPVLFGIEADIQGADLRDSRSRLNGALGIVSTYDQRLDWFGTVRGRLGLVTGSTVSYVTGGYAYGNVRNSVTETAGLASAAFTTDEMRGGYVLGSGVEAALGGNWTGKVEYLYVDLGKRTDAFALLTVPQTMTSRYRENIFRAGLNYRIGGGMFNPTPANWNGFYLGGNIGSGTSRNPSTIAAAGVTDAFSLAPDGYNGGVQAGYNWQASSWVFGLEGDVQGSLARDNRSCNAFCGVAGTGASYDAKLPWFATVRGRLGYAVGSTLFYATGGYAVGGVKTNVTATPPTTLASLSTTRSGYAVGGGIETPFTFLGLFGPNWTTKTEYLYLDLGSTANTFAVGGVPTTVATRVSEHIFRTGINYHFNSPVVARY